MNFNPHKSMAATRGEATSILYALKGQVVRA